MATAPAIAAPPYSSASLYVGDLANEVTEAIIFDTFNAVGPVASVRVCRDAATRRSLGYAYVNFHRVEDADRALETMNFKPILRRNCRIMWSHRDPSLRKSGAGNVFINRLAPTIDNKTLYDTFSTFGNILSCKVAVNKKNESLGYGFVHYESEEAASQAIQQVNGKMIAGSIVSVIPFKSKKERAGGPSSQFTNIFIKNLPEEMTDDEFKAMFEKHGEITSLKLGPQPLDRKNGKKGTRYGFVNYADAESAQKAIEAMNDTDMGERKLYVGKHQKKEERERELRRKHEAEKLERQKQYRGVNLYVKNLADDVNDEKLAQNFETYGTITSAKVMMDKTTGKTRGFGFVCFSQPEEATRAVTEMNGRMVDNKPLYVALAQRKDERRAQLETQYATRNKFAPGAPQMYPQGAPMFYPGGIQRPPVMYPQQMVPGRWVGQRNPQQMVPGQVPARVNYQLMPASMVNGRQTGGNQGGRRGRSRQGQGGQGKQGAPQQGQPVQQGQPQQQMGPRGDQQVRYNVNVRNQQGQPQQQMGPGGPVAQQQRPTAGGNVAQPLTSTLLVAAPPEQKKQMIGERLFPLVQARQPEKAGKITGMLLEMDDTDLIHLLDSDKALDDNIKDALAVLDGDDEESDEEESDEEEEEQA
eukprot:gb/GEZN01002331.1/.p1 GENE.gb/GEZN01002331.1/~~gb/GEZN01002331.1/.p1  ORF type:complete len:642 (+),score=124.64 gb/GEZN01002331.1/:268-2193(+)